MQLPACSDIKRYADSVVNVVYCKCFIIIFIITYKTLLNVRLRKTSIETSKNLKTL